jgi:hypothetical protein
MQPDDVGGFTPEIRIVGGHRALDPLWAKPRLAPRARHPHVDSPRYVLSQRVLAARAPQPRGIEAQGTANPLIGQIIKIKYGRSAGP